MKYNNYLLSLSMKKLLFITPHLSTGGLPQFLLQKVLYLYNTFDIYVVEWDNISDAYIIQKEQLKILLKEKLYTLPENKREILNIIKQINPNVIHFEEFPETFVDSQIITEIYKDKSYNICETTHGTMFDLESKITIPDKTFFVSGNNLKQYISLTNEFDVIEYPTEKLPLKTHFQKELNLSIDYFHILNVGLFTPGKNQKEIIDLAHKFKNKKVQFHFIGNQADNFKEYWEPLLKDLPENCKIWGERMDVFKFYSACDLFLFTSKFENRPLVIKEVLNYNVPILMYNLPNYGNSYNDYENIHYLKDNIEDNVNLISSFLSTEYQNILPDIVDSIQYKINACHLLTDVFAEREMKSIRTISKLKDYSINYKMCLNKPYKELPPKDTCAFPEIVDINPGGKLTPAHYGCYLAHKNALIQSINENNSDFTMIFECDCGIKVSLEQFVQKIHLACNILNDNKELTMFSFVHHHNESILEYKSNYIVISEFIGAHAYLIPKRSYKFFEELYEKTPWNVTDLFFANNLRKHNAKVGVFDEVLTIQFPGYSLLEKITNDEEKI